MRKGIVIHKEVAAAFDKLTMEQRGELITALFAWANGKKYEIKDKTILPFWGWLEEKQQEMSDNYEKTCALRKEFGKKGAKSRWQKIAKNGKHNQTQASTYKLSQVVANIANPNPNPNPNPRSSKEDSSVPGTEQKNDLLGNPIFEEKINWSAELRCFVGGSTREVEEWKKTYPLIDVGFEIARSEQWLRDNPKCMKEDFKRYIGGWLRTAQKDAEKNPKPVPQDVKQPRFNTALEIN
jgi:hypothetical protein